MFATRTLARSALKRTAVGVNNVLENGFGFRVQRVRETTALRGLDNQSLSAMKLAGSRTMLDPIQQYTTYCAARYVGQNNLGGEIVEFGVWRGGSSILILRGLVASGATQKKVFLFDTFQGMSEPSEKDRWIASGRLATSLLEESASGSVGPGKTDMRCIADITDVKESVRLSEYPTSNVHLIQGDVSDTIGSHIPSTICLARLDTDWYESTRIELETVWPRLVAGGVLIIDDYDEWSGAREATDEFLATQNFKPFLIRSGLGRVIIKTHD